MTAKTLDAHIEATPEVASGRPRIAGRRITVQNIAIWHDRLGLSVDEIASEYDLTPAEIHAAMAYYFDHRDSIDEDIRASDAFVAALKAATASKLAEKLRTHGR